MGSVLLRWLFAACASWFFLGLATSWILPPFSTFCFWMTWISAILGLVVLIASDPTLQKR